MRDGDVDAAGEAQSPNGLLEFLFGKRHTRGQSHILKDLGK